MPFFRYIHIIGMWRSLVARFVRDEEVAGSNPVIPTRNTMGSQANANGPVFMREAWGELGPWRCWRSGSAVAEQLACPTCAAG